MNFQRNILLMTFCLSYNLSNAQVDTVHVKTNHKIVLSVSFGSAIPIGSFAGYERENSNVYLPSNIIGGAKMGYNVKVEGKYLFSKNLGVLFIVSMTSNKIEEVPYNVLYPPDEIPALGGGGGSTSFLYSSTNWRATNLLAGFTSQFENGIMTFGVKLSGGYQQLKSPQINIDEIGGWWQLGNPPLVGFYTKNTFQSSITKNILVFDLGFDVKIRILKSFGIVGNIDCLGSHPSFDSDIKYTYDYTGAYSGHVEYSVASHFDKTISYICLNAGLSYSIR